MAPASGRPMEAESLVKVWSSWAVIRPSWLVSM